MSQYLRSGKGNHETSPKKYEYFPSENLQLLDK